METQVIFHFLHDLSHITGGNMNFCRNLYVFVKRPVWILSQIIRWVIDERKIRKEEVQRSPSMWYILEMISDPEKSATLGEDSKREYLQTFDLARSLRAARKARLKYLKDWLLHTSPEYWA